MFRPFTVFSPVVKTRDPSSSKKSYHTGATWGRPSARTVASFAVRGGSPAKKARTSSSDIGLYAISQGSRRWR